MANKGLPKKYAKMGFKKGWAAYKRSKRSTPAKRKVGNMAKRRSYRRTVRRARSFGGGMKPIIDGVLAGALGGVLTNYIGGYGHAAATVGVGYFRNNVTLKTEGAREIGAMLASNFFGGSGINSGGFWE